MNGTVPPPHAIGKPFDDLRLSLDPATLDRALGKRQVRAIELDGTLAYKEDRTTNDKLTEQLERVWNEYPNGLLDISEDKLKQLPADGLAVEDVSKQGGEVVQRDTTKMMESEDMEQLRSEVYGQLNEARNELWFVLELAKTLSASSSFTSQPPPPPAHAVAGGLNAKKGKQKPPAKVNEGETKRSVAASGPAEPPVLPPGTYTTTPSSIANKQTHAQVHELELVLAAKQQALDECSALIDSAVTELQMMASAGDRFWRDVRTLKDGRGGKDQWAIVPKPDFGRLMGDGAKAKDVIIPYAVDEAPQGMRSRCLAAFDLDPTRQDALTFGARSYLRLRAMLKDVSGGILGSTPVPRDSGTDVRAQMEAAQMEAFDEDLFNELRNEASRVIKNEITPRTVAIPAAGYTLTFELYDTRRPVDTPTSPLCDLVVSSVRLNLLNLHRYRKAYLIGSSTAAERTPPRILQPVIQALRYRQLCNTIESNLNNFARTLNAANIGASTTRDMFGSKALNRVVQKILVGSLGVDGLGGSYKLEIDGCPGVRIDISAPFKTRVALSHASFELTNPDNLSHILSEELSAQILRSANRTIQDCLSDDPAHKDTLFYDELENLVHLGTLGYLRITVPPPFHTVLCHVDPLNVISSDNRQTIQGYDARQGGDLRGWLEEIAIKIRGLEE
ncbi:hypothetical protein I316_03375 [Kwoniella heveanensis BCC8398]|uniref:Mediator of RNA polymerase II transcription subunit 17 n=1 Tax=Kwoniella heveanensis BCC8398 TaxID=1296120 RepID=A0A1B9GUW3_9TREE|nr:hypothetical protein I316_03375 [Kwoniella heveanensis BCC8398]